MTDSSVAASSRALLSLLGMGRNTEAPYYDPCRYRGGPDQKVSVETPLVQRGVRECLGPFARTILIGTKEVNGRWFGDDRLFLRYCDEEPVLRVVPFGMTVDEMWTLFETVRSTISELSRDHDEIIVDVTHGFRNQAMTVVSAAQFAMSEWQRLRLEREPRLRIVYGAHDARVEGVAPIWDITELLMVSRWNSALDALARYGRADDLEALARTYGADWARAAREAGVTGRELGRERFIARLGAAARAFADDLALARVPKLLTSSAPALRDALDPEKNEGLSVLRARIPALGPTLEWLRDEVSRLCAPSVLDRDGVRTGIALARFYGSTQRFSEQAATLREMLVTWVGLGAGLDPGRTARPDLVDRDTRKRVDEFFGEVARNCMTGDATARLANRVGQVRNDVQHAGFNPSPRAAADLRRELAKLVDEVEALLDVLPES